ncbi:unnamed protein product, partial [Prorocentrum cordatum]
SARFVYLAGYVSGPFYAVKGVMAGCSFATSFVRVYTIEAFTNLVYPSNVSFDQHIDDSAVSAVGSVSEVPHGLKSASAQLFQAITHDCGCKTAVDKAALVSSSHAVTRAMRSFLGPYAGTETDSA